MLCKVLFKELVYHASQKHKKIKISVVDFCSAHHLRSQCTRKRNLNLTVNCST